MQNAALLAGRLILAACIFPPALGRALNISGFAFNLGMKGIVYPSGMATLVVVTQLFGPLALMLGLAPRLCAGALIAALIISTGILHRFWEVQGVAGQLDQAVFMGNLALVAGLIFYAVAGPGGWSWQAFWSRSETRSKPRARKQSGSRAPRARPVGPREAAEAA